MDKINFTQEQLDKMVKLHEEGMLNKDIAQYFNTSRSTIDRKLAEMGVQSRHPWLTKERRNKAIELYQKYHNIFKVSKELHMGERTIRDILIENNIHILTVAEQRVKYDSNYFHSIDSNNKAYFLGLLAADGTVNNKTTNIQLSLQEQDGYLIEKLKEEIGYDGKLMYLNYNAKNPNWSNQIMLSICNQKIHDDLIKQGIVPNKSYNLEFPNKLDPKYYSHFCRGVLDGDGSISKKECRAQIVSTESFCISLKSIIEDLLHIHCSTLLCHGRIDKPTRVLQIAGRNQVKTFLDWIYQDAEIYMERKYKIYQDVYYKTA